MPLRPRCSCRPLGLAPLFDKHTCQLLFSTTSWSDSTTNHRLLRKNDECLSHTTQSWFLRIVGAIALAIVLAVGGSAAIAGFLTDWGRYGNPHSGQSPATQPSQTAAPSATTAPSSSSPTSHGNEQTATALHAIATAENQVRHGKVFNLRDQDDGRQRLWSAKVANPDGRQFNLTIATTAGASSASTRTRPPTTMSARSGQPRSRLKTPSTPPSSRPEARAA
jgi:cytoskeletal protein RodZ